MAKIKQRYKLYKAEVEAIPLWRWFASPDAAQKWIDKRVRSKWWRSVSDVRHVKLDYPYMGKMSGTNKEGSVGTLSIIPESLCVPTVVHEMTHLIIWIPGADPETDHGPRFAGALIEAYRHLDSAETAADVQIVFDDRGVKWEPFSG